MCGRADVLYAGVCMHVNTCLRQVCVSLPVTGLFIFVNQNTAHGQCVMRSYRPVFWWRAAFFQATAGKLLQSFKDFSAALSRTPSGSSWLTMTHLSGMFWRVVFNVMFLCLFIFPFLCTGIQRLVRVTVTHTFRNRFCLGNEKVCTVKERNTFWEKKRVPEVLPSCQTSKKLSAWI